MTDPHYFFSYVPQRFVLISYTRWSNWHNVGVDRCIHAKQTHVPSCTNIQFNIKNLLCTLYQSYWQDEIIVQENKFNMYLWRWTHENHSLITIFMEKICKMVIIFKYKTKTYFSHIVNQATKSFFLQVKFGKYVPYPFCVRAWCFLFEKWFMHFFYVLI